MCMYFFGVCIFLGPYEFYFNVIFLLFLIFQNLMSSVNVKRILGLVLALGNYMNGGNVL